MGSLFEHDTNDSLFYHNQGDKMNSNNFQENNEAKVVKNSYPIIKTKKITPLHSPKNDKG